MNAQHLHVIQAQQLYVILTDQQPYMSLNPNYLLCNDLSAYSKDWFFSNNILINSLKNFEVISSPIGYFRCDLAAFHTECRLHPHSPTEQFKINVYERKCWYKSDSIF